MGNSDKHTATRAAIQEALNLANSAFIDGGLDNLAFKHKQLYALFDCLQKEAEHNPKIVSSDLESTLESISHLLDRLPRDLAKQYRTRRLLGDLRGSSNSRNRALGTVVVVANEAHPCSSWAIPLSQAIVDGNAALVLTLSHAVIVPEGLRKRLDKAAFPFVQIAQQDLATVLVGISPSAGLVCSNSMLPRPLNLPLVSSFELRGLADGPVPVIIDQSVLPGGVPLATHQPVPRSVSDIAQRIAASLPLRRASTRSLGAPTFVLVHENVLEPLLDALRNVLPADIEAHSLPLIENLTQIKPFLAALETKPPTFLPVYAVRSLDMAIDFVQNDIPTPAVTYVFASHAFGAYAFNSIKAVPAIHLNDVPRPALSLGPYSDPRAFACTASSSGTFSHKVGKASPAVEPSLESIKRIRARPLKQSEGHRIDFFGGSFLFAAGLTVSAVLGSVGYGVVKASLLLWQWYKTK